MLGGCPKPTNFRGLSPKSTARFDSGPDKHPQPGRSSPRIGLNFRLGRGEGLASQAAAEGYSATGAAGESRWADAGIFKPLQGVFDDPVFAGVKGDKARPPPGSKPGGCGIEQGLEGLELAVNGDAQGLEDERRGVETAAARAAKNASRELGELAGGLELACRGRLLHRACEPARRADVAVVVEDVGERVGIEASNELTGGLAGLRHAHVEGSVLLKGEASLWGVDLVGGDADIGEEDVESGRCEPECAELGVEVGKVVGDEGDAAGNIGERMASMCDGVGILIEGDEVALGSDALSDEARVPCPAEGTVDSDRAGLWGERIERLFHQNRSVIHRRVPRRGYDKKERTPPSLGA